MNKTAKAITLVAVTALAVAGCGSKPTSNTNAGSSGNTSGGMTSKPPAQNASFTGCMVSDVGGFNDKSFNQTSLLGLQNAVKDYGIKMAKIQSNSPSEYAGNINAMISAHCNSIVTVGFTLAAATETAAKKNPSVDFAIVDNAYTKPPTNLKGLVFNTAQPAFLAGYLAAGMSKNKVVGTYGGQNIPPVTIYMDGFWDGVQYYNQKHNDKVQVIGWNEKTQNGTFTNDFTTKVKGQTTAQNMISQGADIIFPVAGADGLGALQAAKDSGGKVNAIWVDTDGCVSAPEYCSVLLTSAEKNMQVAVESAVKAVLGKTFTNTPYVGTFSNGGVGLAPFHDWAGKIPTALQDELKQVKQELISGTIKIASPAIPK
ncbi:MAG: BMP family lipoprotein [Nocardioidaceae bacterium]